jgi:hypothetical protein
MVRQIRGACPRRSEAAELANCQFEPIIGSSLDQSQTARDNRGVWPAEMREQIRVRPMQDHSHEDSVLSQVTLAYHLRELGRLQSSLREVVARARTARNRCGAKRAPRTFHDLIAGKPGRTDREVPGRPMI